MSLESTLLTNLRDVLLNSSVVSAWMGGATTGRVKLGLPRFASLSAYESLRPLLLIGRGLSRFQRTASVGQEGEVLIDIAARMVFDPTSDAELTSFWAFLGDLRDELFELSPATIAHPLTETHIDGPRVDPERPDELTAVITLRFLAAQ